MDKTKFVFPVAYDFGRDERGVNEGLTMREYFAAKAIQGILSNPNFGNHQDYQKHEDMQDYIKRKCHVAIGVADIMIGLLNK